MNRLIANIQARRPWMLENKTFSYGFTKAPDNMPDANDAEIASRLIASYRQAVRESRPLDRGHDVWSQFVEKHYGDMIALIESGHAPALATYLTALPRQGRAMDISRVRSPSIVCRRIPPSKGNERFGSSITSLRWRKPLASFAFAVRNREIGLHLRSSLWTRSGPGLSVRCRCRSPYP